MSLIMNQFYKRKTKTEFKTYKLTWRDSVYDLFLYLAVTFLKKKLVIVVCLTDFQICILSLNLDVERRFMYGID